MDQEIQDFIIPCLNQISQDTHNEKTGKPGHKVSTGVCGCGFVWEMSVYQREREHFDVYFHLYSTQLKMFVQLLNALWLLAQIKMKPTKIHSITW